MIKRSIIVLIAAGAIWAGCSSDVSIMKRVEPSTEETAVINEPESGPEDSQSGSTTEEPAAEPSGEMTELTVGFAEIHFR